MAYRDIHKRRRNDLAHYQHRNEARRAAGLCLRCGKTGSRTVHLSPSAADVLKSLSRDPGNPWVVPGAKLGTT